MRLSLEFIIPDADTLDASNLNPDRLCRLPLAEIQRQSVVLDGQPVPLSEVCRISHRVEVPDEILFLGDTLKCAYMGRGMSGGRLIVRGDAGYAAGAELNGGELVIHGQAGECLGSRMRRGTIWVEGDAGKYCAENMRAGTIFCSGKLGRYAGIGMKRGSLVAECLEDLLPGFSAAGFSDGEWLRIYFRALGVLGIIVPPHWQNRSPQRFTGDHLESGKGEILVYASLE